MGFTPTVLLFWNQDYAEKQEWRVPFGILVLIDCVHISFDVAVACDSVSRSCLSQNGRVTVTRKALNVVLDRKSAVLGVVLPLKKSG